MLYHSRGKGIKHKLHELGSYFLGFPSHMLGICVWAVGSLKSKFDKAHVIQTRPRFKIPSERRWWYYDDDNDDDDDNAYLGKFAAVSIMHIHVAYLINL